LQAARILTVHAAILADEPLQIALGVLDFGKAHQGPGACGQVVWVLIGPGVGSDLIAQVVPFHAGDLTGLAADAFARVDELGNRYAAGRGPDPWLRQGRGRSPPYVE